MKRMGRIRMLGRKKPLNALTRDMRVTLDVGLAISSSFLSLLHSSRLVAMQDTNRALDENLRSGMLINSTL